MPICWNCGKEATMYPPVITVTDRYYKDKERFDVNCQDYRIEKIQRGYCEECGEAYIKERDADKAEYVRLKKKLMLERAIRILEKQKTDIYKWRDAIAVVKEFLEKNPNKFESSHEMVAAIVLVENEVRAKTQYRVGNRRIDLLLPDLKVALEIDGGLHEHTLYKDNERDIEIRDEIGKDWEIVRIKTEYLEQNAAKLVDAIKAIRDEKKRIRANNYGLLPEWYSKRESAKRKKKQNYGDELLLG